MATYMENLETARDQCAERLVEITASPKPSYNVNGQQVSWTAYQQMLTKQISELNSLIAQGEPDTTPTEIISQGLT
jgi:DNA-binding ferritin-like protein